MIPYFKSNRLLVVTTGSERNINRKINYTYTYVHIYVKFANMQYLSLCIEVLTILLLCLCTFDIVIVHDMILLENLGDVIYIYSLFFFFHLTLYCEHFPLTLNILGV